MSVLLASCKVRKKNSILSLVLQMAGDKSHKRKKTTKKAQKKKVAKGAKGRSKDGAEKAEPMSQEAARKQNPKAFVFSSRGKAKVQQARTAEKEQRRMHGMPCKQATKPCMRKGDLWRIELHSCWVQERLKR